MSVTKLHNYVRNASNENSVYVQNVSNKDAHLDQYCIHVCRRTFPRESHLVVSLTMFLGAALCTIVIKSSHDRALKQRGLVDGMATVVYCCGQTMATVVYCCGQTMANAVYCYGQTMATAV